MNDTIKAWGAIIIVIVIPWTMVGIAYLIDYLM